MSLVAEVCHLPDAWARGKIGMFPPALQKAVKRRYLAARNRALTGVRGVLDDGREAEANGYLRSLVDQFPAKSLDLGASDSSLVAYAKARAKEVTELLRRGVDMTYLADYCQRHGVALPVADSDLGIRLRVTCDLWWRRQLRRVNARRAESLSIALGLVHKRHALYASHDAVRRRSEQKRRNRSLLEALVAINELGEQFSLEQLSMLGVSNPAIRRAELMCRIAGFEHIAIGLGLAGEFVTITAPSRYHPRLAASGQRNIKYDGVSTPTDTRNYLGKVWGRIGAALARADIKIFGFRVAEPHHDGTPHFHGLFFLDKSKVKTFRCIVAKHAVRADAAELGLDYCLTHDEALLVARGRRAAGEVGSLRELADRVGWEAAFWASPSRGVWRAIKARVTFKAIDWRRGTAAGYIAKYIAKNIDGQRQDGSSVGQDFEALGGVADGDDGATRAQDQATDMLVTARRVDAWASTWGIRQFQQIGGPPVGVWRELRRYDYQEAEDVLLQASIAADAGNWGRFVEVMGGYEAKRSQMPVSLAKESGAPLTRYGEPAQPRVFGVVESGSGQLAVTRMHEWTVGRKAGVVDMVVKSAAKAATVREFAVEDGVAVPWTRVNNSTILTLDMPASLERIALEVEEGEIAAAIRPVDDGFRPAAQLAAERVQAQQTRLSFEDEQRRFMQFADQWAQQSETAAKQVRATQLWRRADRALTKQLASPDGLAVISEVNQAIVTGDRWRKGGPPKRRGHHPRPGVSAQLAGAVTRAQDFLSEGVGYE